MIEILSSVIFLLAVAAMFILGYIMNKVLERQAQDMKKFTENMDKFHKAIKEWHKANNELIKRIDGA